MKVKYSTWDMYQEYVPLFISSSQNCSTSNHTCWENVGNVPCRVNENEIHTIMCDAVRFKNGRFSHWYQIRLRLLRNICDILCNTKKARSRESRRWSQLIEFWSSLRQLLPFSMAGCRPGNGEKLNRSQAEPGQAITSAVAYFPSISCATSCYYYYAT